MDLKSFLLEKRTSVLERWLGDVLSSYPSQTAEFIRNRKNQFANPVGSIISEGISGIFDGLLAGLEADAQPDAGVMADFLEDIIKVRAIQDFSASQALGFIFSLKKAVRDEVGALGEGGEGLHKELGRLDGSIDRLALAAFDVYSQCRERIYELKANEVRNQTYRILQQANLICGTNPAETGKGGGNGDSPEKKIG
ncbi:MAG: RsbRD N-terminal domain-containing protein [Nitrospiraceae bacterium]|nr:RsbRD N-terminal domain-containing protein [Nitrospiraceae bacterium]